MAVLGLNQSPAMHVTVSRGVHEVLRMSWKILRVANFNYIVLFIVVADMVLKPSLTDTATLVGMAVIFIAAGILFIPPRFTSQVAQMADLGKASRAE